MHNSRSHSLSLLSSIAVLLCALFVMSRMPSASAAIIFACTVAFAVRRIPGSRLVRLFAARRRSKRRMQRRAARLISNSPAGDKQLQIGDDHLRFSVYESGGSSQMGLMMVEPGSAVSSVCLRSLSFWVVLGVYVHGVWRGDVFLDAANGVTVEPGDLVSVSGTAMRLGALAGFFQQSPTNPAHID